MNPLPRFFTSEYEHSIDSVNRLVIPAKWRTGESEDFFVIPSDEGCLRVLTGAGLQELDQKIEVSTDMSEAEKQKLKEDIFPTVEQVTCDKQGRMTMSPRIMKHAGLKDMVVFVGKGSRFDLWSPKSWQQRKTDTAASRTATRARFGI